MSIFAKDVFLGKHALVTGASGGVGSATAKLLVSMGAKVTLCGRNGDKLNQVKEEILKTDPDHNLFVCPTDIGSDKEREQLVDEATKSLGPITLLVNAAGISGNGLIEHITQEELEKVMHINYTSTVLLTQLVYRGMIEQKEGAIVNVASMAAVQGKIGNGPYSASKFALIGFTHSLALEAIKQGVRVNAVCPGVLDNEMGLGAIKRKAKYNEITFDEQLELLSKTVPSGRISTSEDVANTIAFLLTDAGENIVGETIKISGGVFS